MRELTDAEWRIVRKALNYYSASFWGYGVYRADRDEADAADDLLRELLEHA